MPSRSRSMGRALGMVAAGVVLLLQAPVQSAESGKSTAGGRSRVQAGADASGDVPDAPAFASGQLLALVTPSQGNELDGETMEFRLRISTSLDQSTLEVSLNGSPIESKFHETACTSTYCDETAEVTVSDGLLVGKNGLTATAHGSRGIGDSARVRFDWYPEVHTAATRSLPATLAFETIRPGGGSPWIRIGTETFPTSGQTCAGSTMQVLVLDRFQLTQKAFRCFNDAADINGYLGQMTRRDLVVAGTTSFTKLAFPGLNTSAIGGSNLADANEFPEIRKPLFYMIVGVGGAQPGQAYETFSVPLDREQPFPNEPQATGMLSEDTTSAYNFHASDRRVFEVIPGDRSSSVEIGNQVYTSGSGVDGFWVLKIERVTLQPIDAERKNGKLPCQYNAERNDACGKFFATGSADAATAVRAIGEMATYLSDNRFRRNLFFVVSVGTPLTSRAKPNEALFRAIDALGGSGYLLMQLANTSEKNQKYSLVSAHDHGYHTSLLGKAALSTSLLTQQKQTGRLRGLLVQNHFALFSPMEAVQDPATGDERGRLDFSFQKIVMEKPGPWPYSDSPGHRAAYRVLSWEMLHEYLKNPAGDHLDDVRFYYTGSQNKTIAGGRKDPKEFLYQPSECACTRAEWEDTAKQLSTEKAYLNQLINFFGNATEGSGIGGVIAGSGTSVTLSLLTAANEVKSGVLQPDPNQKFSLNASGLLRLAQGVVNIGQLFAGPYAVPVGLVGGVFNISATLAGGLQPAALPNPEYAFSTTLGELTRATSTYLDNMQNAFNTSIDSIYTDWSKLDQAGRKVADTTNGWYYVRQADYGADVRQMMNKAMQRDAYLQLMRPYYGVDFWPNSQVSSYDRIGSIEVIQTLISCQAFYRDKKTPAEAASTYAIPGGQDILVIAGEITNNRDNRVKEKNVPLQLLNTLLGDTPDNLNMPREVFLGPSGPLSRRDGPMYSNRTCTLK